VIRLAAAAKTALGIALALSGWQALAWWGGLPAEYFPGLAGIAVAGWNLVRSPDFLLQVSTTSLRAVSGLTVALTIGLSTAIAAGRYRLLRRMLGPAVDMLRVLPPPAIVPISIFVLGIGAQLFLFIIAFASLWPIYINAANALAAAEPVQMLTGRCLGYSDWEILLRLRLPAALPEIVTGIRISAGVALLATIAAEMLAGQSGLGFLLYDAAFSLRTPDMFAIMATTGVLGLLFSALVRQASRLVVGWHLAMTALTEPA
jgi:ABC-type nitrate/sulfonate/bicarbonate transport system permease component